MHLSSHQRELGCDPFAAGHTFVGEQHAFGRIPGQIEGDHSGVRFGDHRQQGWVAIQGAAESPAGQVVR
jgi:hypothetical protein